MQYLGISGLVAGKSEGSATATALVSSGVQAGALRRCRARYIENALRRKRALAVDRASYLTEFFRLRLWSIAWSSITGRASCSPSQKA